MWTLALSARIAQPMENAINKSYFRDAQKKLQQNPDLIRIGITGSYGKTSTKFILATLLSEKYNVLATPSSFNTPMGITRVVREQLKDEHQVFIAEMGARQGRHQGTGGAGAPDGRADHQRGTAASGNLRQYRNRCGD